MADWNRAREVKSDPEQSGGAWRPPLPRPDNGDNVRPVPLWEREFCRNAYDVPWKTFCGNKRCIEIIFNNVMDWDDSGSLKNFLDAKERFRKKYFGEPYEDPVLDPDTYVDGIDHHCKVDPNLIADLDKTSSINLVADLGSGGTANLTPMTWEEPIGNLIPPGWGKRDPNLKPTGWGEPADPPPAAACGGQDIQTPEVVGGDHPYCTKNSSNYNLHGGRVNQRNRAEGQHQRRNSGGMQRTQGEGWHQMRRGGLQQQVQRGRKMEWRPVNRAPKDDPAA